MNIQTVSNSVKMQVKRNAFMDLKKCWFKHNPNQENYQNQNEEITSKLFNMMEIFTERIMKIEKQMEMTIK